jgi:hypothetical protein
MSRFFGINTFGLSEQGMAGPVTEQLLSPVKSLRLAPIAAEPSYNFDGRQVCIGMGQALDPDADSFEWSPLFVLSFALDSQSGQAELLARHELGAPYSEGIYALDLIQDGVVELVVPWATGVAGGGGVDVIAVVPTGGLAGFSGPDGDPGATGSSFYTASGAFNLLDYNGDGDWEIETSYPPFAAAFAYYYPTLYSFDRASWRFIPAETTMPEY